MKFLTAIAMLICPTVATAESLEARKLLAADFYVSAKGDDTAAGTDAGTAWRTVQHAADVATPGSTVHIAAGVYTEKVEIRVSGNAAAGPITFAADAPLGSVVLDGSSRRGPNLIHIENQSYVRIVGLELRDNLKVKDGSGIRIEGAADHIELLGNRIHRIRGKNAMGITIYGTDAAQGIGNLVVDRNEIFNCQPAKSEALTLNGNVHDFAVTNNLVHDVNNIGIDFIGHEGTCPDPFQDQARNGLCQGNRVFHARSNYGGGYAAGIYVDGGRDIVVERNVVYESNLGIEIGCEHPGKTASGIVVRDNLLYRNDKAGLGIGGYEPAVGRVVDCQVVNNTLYHNDEKRQGNGELWIQLASNCAFTNNLVVANRQGLLVNQPTFKGVVEAAPPNRLDYNLYFCDEAKSKPAFVGGGKEFESLPAYTADSGQDAHSQFGDPLLVDPSKGDFHLNTGSPAIDAGDPTLQPASGETDLDGAGRRVGERMDIGADERAS